ncbi:hypothetical protein Cgig2_017888 [Carnegiea gigantea]|uniref:Uncharacterized protein n=1 Tax=Carnegiea gigantea TaxID=171969 RepID=A0A9Q1JZP8_9CARY|nr:hypothetical protein Cgig2_017888 [Carnegiea gigantea]
MNERGPCGPLATGEKPWIKLYPIRPPATEALVIHTLASAGPDQPCPEAVEMILDKLDVRLEITFNTEGLRRKGHQELLGKLSALITSPMIATIPDPSRLFSLSLCLGAGLLQLVCTEGSPAASGKDPCSPRDPPRPSAHLTSDSGQAPLLLYPLMREPQPPGVWEQTQWLHHARPRPAVAYEKLGGGGSRTPQ